MFPVRPIRLALVLAFASLGACDTESPAVDVARPSPMVPFVDATADTGLAFRHFNGMSGRLWFSEMVGPGLALFDFDGDGDLDLFLGQGHRLGDDPDDALVYAPPGEPGGRLYRNDLDPDSGEPSFTDVTDAMSLQATGYSMGVAVGDYDRDGDPDLYLANFGPNQLWRNDGGRFTEVSEIAGVQDPRWSTSTAFADLDADGWPDLFAAAYVDYRIERHKQCFTGDGAKDYCGPKSYRPLVDKLWRNLGDGRFEDIGERAGIREPGAGLGVVAADLDGDGMTDLAVANDGMVNHLWLNQGEWRFMDDALMGGIALNRDGAAEASMGIDLADYDNDGDPDLFMTHLKGETNTLYRNDGTGLFEDVTAAAGLGDPSRGYTAFGTAWLDYDNDGWLDLFVANGEVRQIQAQARAGDPHPLHQPNQLFRNLGDGRFADVTAESGPALEPSEVSRGVAVGDLDNDGDADLVITNNAGPARVLLNQIGNRNAWIGLELVDGETGGPLPGVRVEVLREGHPPLWRRSRVAVSYLAANDPRVLVGLGDWSGPVDLRVHWTDGSVGSRSRLETRRYHRLVRGEAE